jgi:predicted RNA-binding protein YlqC (UPF0109 family)
MNDLLTTILKNITTKPDAVSVVMAPEGDVELYTISVDPDDVGRVIGKSGKVIRAIRSLCHVAAVHAQKKVRVHLDDSNAPAPQAMQQPVTTAQTPAEPVVEAQPVAGEVDLTLAQATPVAPVVAPDTADLLPEEA